MDKEEKKFIDNKETRLIEMRAVENDDNKMVVEGYAVVFNQPTLIGDEEFGWYEVIDRNALDGADMKDVPLKYQHGDTKGVLARTRNGSLQLMIDDHGLKIRAELIDTQDNIDIYKSIKAGLLYQMSFAFNVVEEKIDNSTSPITRTITKIGRLFDTSVVDFGAYPTTSIYARSKEIVGEQLRNLQPSVETDEATLDNVEVDDTEKRKQELELRKRKFKFKNNLLEKEEK